MKSILDRSFKYTPSANTDLRATFRRVRREQRREQVERGATNPVNLVMLTPRKAKT